MPPPNVSATSLNEAVLASQIWREKNLFQGQAWCQGHPEGHSSVDPFISICSLLQTDNATACGSASLRNIATITVP